MSSVKLSSSEKEKFNSIFKDFDRIQWEKGEYYFHNFVDYYQLPQIIRVKQKCQSDFKENQWLFLQSLFDRYLIIGTPLISSEEKYLIPDWFQGECRILSKTPRLKQRWWVFQGAFELYRFQLPRRIKILSHTPAHRRNIDDPTLKDQWEKVILSKNGQFNVIRREQYQSRVKNDHGDVSISEPKEAFVLQDVKSNDEFLIPPGVPLRFATLIQQNELHAQYYSHDGTFTFPELMIRYEFPLDIEILTHLPIDIAEFKCQIRLEKFCVAKSILALAFDSKQTKLIELSPLTEFTLSCAKCLTFGLPQQGEEPRKDEKFNEKEYQHYEDLRTRLNAIFADRIDIQKSKIQLSSSDEISSIEAAHQLSLKLIEEDEKPLSRVFFSLDEIFRILKEQGNKEINLPKKQPKRFTVHASADPSNPYNEVIDYEDMSAAYENKSENDSATAKETQKKRPALVVQQLPPPMMLPLDSFEKTVKAIPDKLYTEFLPATISKKAVKTEEKAKNSSS